MSCDCQVKDPDPDKPCPVCGDPRTDDLAGSKARERMEAQRTETLSMMRRGWKPKEKT